METLNRPTAPSPRASTTEFAESDRAPIDRPGIVDIVDELRRETRRLQHREPAGPGAEREPLIIELHQLDVDLERLSLRLVCDVFGHDDARQLRHCSHRLSELVVRWPTTEHESNSPA